MRELSRMELILTRQISKRNLTLFLYPDDRDENGHLLRIYQQYFMVSNAAQLILKEAEERGCDLYRLHEHVAIQINDTHPTMVIPELIRLLTQKKGFNMDTAIDVVRKTCAYTNHTILAEALEKWPVCLSGKSGSSADADHPGAGCKGEKRFPR